MELKKKANARVTVRSFVENLDDFGLCESTESDTFTEAALISEKDGVTTLVYEQKTEGGSYENILTLDGETVRLQRSGDIGGVMEFAEGKTTKTVYTVLPFSFDAEIETKKIRSTLCESGGTVELCYLLTIGGAKKRMRLSLTVYK